MDQIVLIQPVVQIVLIQVTRLILETGLDQIVLIQVTSLDQIVHIQVTSLEQTVLILVGFGPDCLYSTRQITAI